MNTKTFNVAMLLAMLISANIAAAQQTDNCRKNIRTGECVSKDRKNQAVSVDTVAKYPNAVRPEPASKGSTKIPAEWKKLIGLSEKQDESEAIIQAAEAVIQHQKSNAFEKSAAAQIAGYARIGSDDYQQAIGYLQKAVEFDGLSNNVHFDLILTIAQLQLGEEQYENAVKTVDRFLIESKSENPKAYALRGNGNYRLEKYDAAILDLRKSVELDPNGDKSVVQMLMASYMESDKPQEAIKYAQSLVESNPGDKATRMNLANMYIMADQPEKAGGVFDGLKAQNMITDTKDYEFAYKLLANIPGRENDAAEIINQGLGSGKLQASEPLYNYLGQTYYFAEQIPKAIAAWKKADELATDGEAALNLSKVLSQEGNDAESKKYVQLALAKGVKKKGDAYLVLARAEGQLNNKAAMIAALKEAAKYPESQAQAKKQLKQAGAN